MTTFGVDFTAHVQETHTEVPHLMRKCTSEIDNRGLLTKVGGEMLHTCYHIAGLINKHMQNCKANISQIY